MVTARTAGGHLAAGASYANHPRKTTALAAAMLLHPRASQAYEGPWCALSDIGGGVIQENCSMRTLEMCRQEVIAGNRGFCNPNPRWQGNPTGVRQSPPPQAPRLLDERPFKWTPPAHLLATAVADCAIVHFDTA